MSKVLLMLLIAAAVPVAAAAAPVLLKGRLSRLAARERDLPRRTTLSVAALLALVATLVVAENPVTAAEGDMHTFSGTITDIDGTALAGINVSVFCQDCPDGSRSDPSANPLRPWPGTRWGSGARVLGEATTDGSGNWSVTVTEPSSGRPLLVAWDPAGDYAFYSSSYWQWTSDTSLNYVLADGGQLSGRIRADGAPPAATGFVLTGWGNDMLWQGISLVVDANGDYSTPGLPDGEYSLSYPADVGETYVSGLPFRLGTISGGTDSTADHDLVKYTSVSGRVTDGSGRGLGGIRVIASPVGTSEGSLVTSPVGSGAIAETAADGTYSFDTIVPGSTFHIVFESVDGEYATESYDDRGRYSDSDLVEVPRAGVTGIDAQLAPASRISGYVRNAEGQPASWSGVRVCPGDSYFCNYESADEAGFFEFGGLAAGVYTLHGPRIERCVIVAEGQHVQVDLEPVSDQEGFIDVPEGAFYSVPVATLAEQGVFAGTEWGNGFCPNAPIARKTMAVWIVRVLDDEDPARVSESRFDDVYYWSFHAPFIERMAELGVTSGCGDGSGFCPDDPVTRAQMAVFLSRAFGLADGPDPGFADVPSDAWYAAAVAKLAASGITSGCRDGAFCPGDDTTRGQMATFLYRAEYPDG